MYAADIVDYYHREGYQGIVITDHFNETTFESFPEYKKDWIACVDRYLLGYRVASLRASELGLDVILGIEFRSTDSIRDTLVYGLDEEFLYRHEYSYELGLERFFGLFGERMTLIAAHPFRTDRGTGRQCSVLPMYLHGAEVINGNPRHENNNHQALELCRANPDFIRVFGSDVHRPVDLCSVYMGFDKRIKDSAALGEALKRREYTLGYPADRDIEKNFAE